MEGLMATASSCCIETAATPDAMFCGECGKAITRCMASQECHGLVGPDGFCPVCVSPQVFIDAGAELDVRVGGTLTLPLTFRNTSPTGRPLRIEQVWTRVGGDKYLPQPLDWDQVPAGQQMSAVVQTPPLATSGRVKFDIAFVAETGWKSRRESYAFSASVEFKVEEQKQAVTINQTINAGDGGNTVYAPSYNEGAGAEQSRRVVLEQALPLNLVRAHNVEREHGVRGYLDGPMKGATVLRTADVIYKGFPDGETPRNGPIATPDSVLKFGRAKTRGEGGEGDVRLLVRDAKGAVDESLSLAISRLHFVLHVQKGRLVLHPYGEAGVMIGEEVLRRDDRILQNGDVIRVLPKNGEALQVQVRMQARHGEVDEIVLARIPALNGDGTR
jgi:hypothetical protein